jgi:hypothetical protein
MTPRSRERDSQSITCNNAGKRGLIAAWLLALTQIIQVKYLPRFLISEATVSVSSASSNSNPSTLQGLYQHHKNDFKTLSREVQSGGLIGAEATSKDLQQMQAVGGATAAGPMQSRFSPNLASLIQAVQSGDLAGAQEEDVTQLQSDMKSQAGGHHRRHHAEAAASTVNANDTPSGTSIRRHLQRQP